MGHKKSSKAKKGRDHWDMQEMYWPQVTHETHSYWIDRVRYKDDGGQTIFVRDQVYRGPTDNQTRSYGILSGEQTLDFGRLVEQKNYSGRGPRNYQPSDLHLQEEICERLTWASPIDASKMEVEVRNGMVFLNGFIDSRKMRRQAEELIEGLPGVRDIANNLKISNENQEEYH